MFSVKRARESVLSVLYHDKRSGITIIKKVMGEYPHRVPPLPTPEDLQVAEVVVERVLFLMYDIALGEDESFWKGGPVFNEALLD